MKGKTASDFAFYYANSSAYKYLLMMEKLYLAQDSVPSMQDGPYISRENDNRIVMTYYEHVREKHLTRLVEKTIETGSGDTIVRGFGWDTKSYHVKHNYIPDPYNVETAGDIFVIGDLHGKYNALVNLLMNNKVIDSSLNWNFGNGQLILLGDIFDRGSMVTETLWFLYELEIQARQAGGNVNLLLGNHEIMTLTGDHRYLNDKYDYFARYTRTDYFLLFEKNTVFGKWLRSKNIIVRMNDCLFMHAGISPEFAAFNYSYLDINNMVREYLNSEVKMDDSASANIILGAIGPLWYRGYFNTNANANDNANDIYVGNASSVFPKVPQDFVDNYLASKGLKRMVLGHNEQTAINSTYEGKVISADVAIDETGKSAQGLLISGEKLYRCLADGTKQVIE
jgi:hypothetical protein